MVKFVRKLMLVMHFCQLVCSDQLEENDKENKDTSPAPTKKVNIGFTSLKEDCNSYLLLFINTKEVAQCGIRSF